MHARPLLFSAVLGGLALGAAAASSIPQMASGPAEPAWRSLIQPQYQMAYAPSHGAGPEDSSAMGLTVVRGNDLAEAVLPPEHAAQERLAQETARAAVEAERAYRQAYREAIALRPAPEPAVSDLADAEPDAAAESTNAEEAPVQAKVLTVAALTSE